MADWAWASLGEGGVACPEEPLEAELAGTATWAPDTSGIASTACAGEGAGGGVGWRVRWILWTKSSYETPEAMYSLSSPFLPCG